MVSVVAICNLTASKVCILNLYILSIYKVVPGTVTATSIL